MKFQINDTVAYSPYGHIRPSWAHRVGKQAIVLGVHASHVKIRFDGELEAFVVRNDKFVLVKRGRGGHHLTNIFK